MSVVYYLMSRGLSQVGAKQVLLGRPITNPVDVAVVQRSNLRNLLVEAGTASGAPSVAPRRGISAAPAGQFLHVGTAAGVGKRPLTRTPAAAKRGELTEQLRLLLEMRAELIDFLASSHPGELFTLDGTTFTREECAARIAQLDQMIALLRAQLG